MGIEREVAAPDDAGTGVGGAGLLHPSSARGISGAAATSAPLPSAAQPLPCLSKPALNRSKPVLSLSKGGRSERTAPAGPGRQPDLRVNVAKCRRMSHFFIPPLGECRTLRVRNLTFWADSRPFWPISVHFRARHPRAPTREPMPSRGRTALYGENPESRPVPAIPSFSCPDTGIHAPLALTEGGARSTIRQGGRSSRRWQIAQEADDERPHPYRSRRAVAR